MDKGDVDGIDGVDDVDGVDDDQRETLYYNTKGRPRWTGPIDRTNRERVARQ